MIFARRQKDGERRVSTKDKEKKLCSLIENDRVCNSMASMYMKLPYEYMNIYVWV